MKFEISHRTAYRYGSPVVQSHHLVHLRPRAGPVQAVGRHSLLIEPAPVSRIDLVDYFDNEATILYIEDEHAECVIHSRSTVEVHAPPAPDLEQSSPWEEVTKRAVAADGRLDISVLQFGCESRHTRPIPEALALARECFPAGTPVLAGAWRLTERIHSDFSFDPTATDISTPVARVFAERRGVCQDFAHVALACLRALGLPARYVSGYLLTRPPPGREKLQGADASHAWVSVWAPEAGWVDYDPTNGLIPQEEHITIGYGRDYDDVSPVAGVLLGGDHQTMTVAVDVSVVA
jgi:transglutaminase-like putative cysteine protease